MDFLRNNRGLAIGGGVVGLAVLAFLAFGVFGIHTAFTDDVVSEDGPVFTSTAASSFESDEVPEATVDEMNDFVAETDMPAEVEVSEPMPDMDDGETAEPQIVELVRGSFIDRSHPNVGTAVVLNDGSEQRFLRFEDDFATDNGPDLNVYLVADVTADGDAGTFDDDFVDLGDLKGNIGAQNYEIPVDVDLDRYNTVVIWCVRFGVAFGAADLV